MVFTSACSAIMEIEMFTPIGDLGGWETIESERKTGERSGFDYRFQHENVALEVADVRLTSGDPVTIGPPCLPFVPRLWQYQPTPSRPFSFDIRIRTEVNTVKFDLYKSKFRLGDGSVVNPTSVVVLGRERSGGPLVKEDVVFSCETVVCELIFDYPNMDLRDCVIDFGEMTVDGEPIKVPPLRYQKTSTYRYAPVSIGDPKPGRIR
jgi:hypothetical protein